MINLIKSKIRGGLGLIDIQKRIKNLHDHNKVLESKLKDTLDYNHRIFNYIEELLDKEKRQLLQEVIQQSKSGSIINCRINYCDILVPVELLQLYSHCIEPTEEKKLNYFLETHCVDWLSSYLNSGDTILDIGASFGTISLPLAKIVGEKGHIYAFEPARKTQTFLQQILEINNISNISIVKSAISDQPGTYEFVEYLNDNSFSWASDTSTLNAPTINTEREHFTYDVDVTTIDQFVATYHLQPAAIKMDIEGFELYGLQGAKTTLDRYHPYLCIDIHEDVKTGSSSLLEIQPFLESLGYDVEIKEHTLFGTPYNGSQPSS
ncbi:MAG: FkbM family methyltransferase [Crocosphaera sp.]